MAAGEPEDFVAYYRGAVAQTVAHNTDSTEIIFQLLCVDRPLIEKFLCLNISDLLAKNGQSSESLRRLIMGLNILEKYGRHLLKPPESRSNMWRHIKFTNTIFRDRVASIQGGREIMTQMGYSVIKQDGVAFPDDADPDHAQVLKLVVDILLAKKEIEAYLSGNHPHPQYIEAYLHPDLVALVQGAEKGNFPNTLLPSFQLSSNTPRSLQANIPTERQEDPKPTGSLESRPSTNSSERQSKFLTASEGKTDEPESESQSSSVTCDICGKNHPDFVCEICDSKQLCRECDRTWHKHPKRQNHKRAPLGSIPLDQSTPPSSPAQSAAGLDTRAQGLQLADGGHVREPMSLYPSQPNNSMFSNMGYSLPANKLMQQAPLQRPGLPHLQNDKTGRDTSLPKSDQSSSPTLTQAWTGPQPNTLSSSPRTPASPFHAAGFTGMPGTSLAAISSPTQLPGSYLRGADSMQGAGPINVVNPMHFQQPGMHYPMSSGIRQPAQSYGMGYSMAPAMPAPVQPYPSSFVPNTMHLFSSPDNTRFGYYPTLPPQTLDRFSGQSFPHQGQNKSMENAFSPRTPDIPKTPSSSSASSSSMSQLLPNIMAVPDPEKRMSRIRVDLMSLQDDIKDWDGRINSIILQNPNFFQDEDYKTLNRKKRRHLQEIQELENYAKELQKSLNEKNENETREREKKKSVEDEQLEMLRNRLSEIKTREQFAPSFPQQQFTNFPYAGAAPDAGIYNLYNVPSTTAAQTPPTSQPLQRHQNIEHRPGPQGSHDEIMDDVRRLLVLDQNPHEFKSNLNTPEQPVMNIPVTTSNTRNPLEVSYPPYMTTMTSQTVENVVRPKYSNAAMPPNNLAGTPDRPSDISAMKHRMSEPNLNTHKETIVPELRKNHSAVDVTVWECEHCTFQNESNNNICAVCCKTSENRKIIGANVPLTTDDMAFGEECEFCTYRNKPGTKICAICSCTQTKYADIGPVSAATETASSGPGDMRDIKPQAGSPRPKDKETGPGQGPAGPPVGKLIDQEQDKVYLEKKAAQEKYEKELEGQGKSPVASGAAVLSPPFKPGPPLNPRPPTTGQLAPNKDIERIRKTSDHDQSSGSSSNYGSAQSSLEQTTENQPSPEMKPIDPQGAIKKARPQLDFAEAIEQISMKREQEQMSIDGHDFVQLIKEAENAGFEIAEISIAQKLGLQDKMKPLDWLKTKWPGLIELVVNMATETGKAADQNDVGDVSTEEAREALIKCDAGVKKAAQMCTEQRAKKYAEISNRGQFAREDILTALFQNHGNVEEAQDQLNHSVVQGYIDRVWNEGEDRRGGGDAAIAAAGRAPDPNNSISNSIIGHEEFQRVIKDTQINRERRVRMVFVEGKLASWGRADTVITILDSEVTNAEEPLECTLEDIIEAVRNCGDRKSSLFYLKQECGICFSLYPMSKISNLSVCDCKICHDCVKMNFEVVIRERYVRNWNCPICDQPDFEDETRASQYFEFLTLILSASVSQEVMDLYETKLRDWHLQKDKNFRWCAHCASGFIWDRPDVLGMTCPHCRQKTCFMCKKKWEDQHEGLSCEQFTQWCINNDPAMQAKGVKVYLEQNGIDCPSCKMRYELAKGGCMHFKCPQCGHEFCSGCYQAFLKDGVCKMFKSCATKGLHCHHPRDCFYWLRDNSPADLQRLLKNHKVVFNTEAPPIQIDKTHCPVMEQKEYGAQKKDEACNAETTRGMAGLCENHYKEYLVDLINKNHIDPLGIMSKQEMLTLIGRFEREPPAQTAGEPDANYRKRLTQFIKENFKLPKK